MHLRDKALFSIFMCFWMGEGPRLMILPWAPISVSRSLKTTQYFYSVIYYYIGAIRNKAGLFQKPPFIFKLFFFFLMTKISNSELLIFSEIVKKNIYIKEVENNLNYLVFKTLIADNSRIVSIFLGA